VGSFSKEERIGRTIDIVETMRLIIWQRLVSSVDGKRIALREYLVFDENVRDELLSVDPERVTAKTRELVQKYGHPMQLEVDKRYEEGLIDERMHKVLTAGLKRNQI
jgi:defect-in-organelle-trafficking protein DotB